MPVSYTQAECDYIRQRIVWEVANQTFFHDYLNQLLENINVANILRNIHTYLPKANETS